MLGLDKRLHPVGEGHARAHTTKAPTKEPKGCRCHRSEAPDGGASGDHHQHQPQEGGGREWQKGCIQ